MSVPGMELQGQVTLLGCWQALARLSPGARVVQAPTLAAGVFPEWAPLNNAIVLAAGPHGCGDGASVARSSFGTFGIDALAL